MCEEVNFRCLNCERFPDRCKGQTGTFTGFACPESDAYLMDAEVIIKKDDTGAAS